jgi:hypothetical protein
MEMSAAVRRRITQLRALAKSTTFPEEAKSATAKADQLEASLPPEQRGNVRRTLSLDELMQAMQDQAQAQAGLSAVDPRGYFNALVEQMLNEMAKRGL